MKRIRSRIDASNTLECVALDFAQKQHGVVARRQLLAAGVPRTTIDNRIRKFLFPLFPGVYAVGRPQIEQDGLWITGVLAAGRGGALGGRSAGAAWGYMRLRPGVEVIREGNRRTDRARIQLDGRPSSIPLIIRRTRSLPEVMFVRSIPVVSPAYALLGVASSLTATGFRNAFIEADRLGLLSDEDLAGCLLRGQGRPGAAALRALAQNRIPDLDRAKSLLEGLMLDACNQEAVEAPEVNVMIGSHEVDCVWRSRRLAVELDSYGFHRGQEMFEKDLARNNQMWASGWVLLRYTWRRVTNEPDQVVKEVRAALTAGGCSKSQVERMSTAKSC